MNIRKKAYLALCIILFILTITNCILNSYLHRDSHPDLHSDSHRDSHTDSHRDSHTNLQRDSHRDSHTDLHRNSHRDSHTDSHRDSHTDSHRDSHTDSHRDSRRDSHRDSHPDLHFHNCRTKQTIFRAPTSLAHLNCIIHNNVCLNETTPLLAAMAVVSHVQHVAIRDVMRRVYPKEELASLGIRRVFVLAAPSRESSRSNDSKTVTDAVISHENLLHGDVIQLGMVEAYDNLTYKSLMSFKYVLEFCSSASFVIKCDDDVTINIYQLVDYLTTLKAEEKDSLHGKEYMHRAPYRTNSRYAIPCEEYPQKFYPAFLYGGFYVTSLKTAAAILEESQRVAFFRLEDVLITGFIATRLGVPLCQLGERFNSRGRSLRCCNGTADGVPVRFHCQYLSMIRNLGREVDEKVTVKMREHARACYYGECKSYSELTIENGAKCF